MKLFQKVLMTIALFSLTTASILTLNYNQVYADEVNVRGTGGVLICPDSNVSFDIRSFGVTADNEGYVFRIFVDGLIISGSEETGQTDVKVLGALGKQRFILNGIVTNDSICNSEVPSDISIKGSCLHDRQVTFKAKNGLEAESEVTVLAECFQTIVKKP